MRRPKIHSETQWWIYLLVDPRVTSGRAQDEVRYVGFSVRPVFRLDVHIEEATKTGRNTHKLNWIRSLLRDKLIPEIRVVDCGRGDTWETSETYWIRFYREEVGAVLTNATNGGEGSLGLAHSDESRHRMSIAKLGKPRSKDTKSKISETMKVRSLAWRFRLKDWQARLLSAA